MVRHAYSALVAVQVLYAMLPAAGKTIFADLDPLAMTTVRIFGAAAVLVAVHVARKGPWPDARMWPGIAMLAVFGIVINMGFFAAGLEYTHPVNATLLITTIPVFTYVIAVVMGREGIGPRRLAGILLAFSGAVYLVGLSRFEASLQTALGDILVLINALSFSFFLVLAKPWMERHDPMALNVWMFLVATVIFLPIAFLVDLPVQASGASSATWWWMAFVILGPTVGAYALNATALRHVPSSTVGVFIFMQPPVSALASWAVLDILPSWKIVPAAGLILAGVAIVARRRRTEPVAAALET